jgi:hypothetical protein
MGLVYDIAQVCCRPTPQQPFNTFHQYFSAIGLHLLQFNGKNNFRGIRLKNVAKGSWPPPTGGSSHQIFIRLGA